MHPILLEKASGDRQRDIMDFVREQGLAENKETIVLTGAETDDAGKRVETLKLLNFA